MTAEYFEIETIDQQSDEELKQAIQKVLQEAGGKTGELEKMDGFKLDQKESPDAMNQGKDSDFPETEEADGPPVYFEFEPYPYTPEKK